jgi:uncharacterized membrane protein YraQ (UPF0718 family)
VKEWKKFAWLGGIFLAAYFLPLGNPKVSDAILEGFRLLQWYAVNHTLACVVPAIFIAGAIATFLSQGAVMRYLGPGARRTTAYAIASVSGMILAVCSCSVLPMFAGIYAMGAGLGPATAFLYSGPAINVMAIFLSARVLGFDLGAARVVGAVVFAVVIGLLMAFFFRRSEEKRIEAAELPQAPPDTRPLWQTALYFLCMILFLVFSDWTDTTSADAAVVDTEPGISAAVHSIKWYLAGGMGLLVLLMVWRWFFRDEVKQWMRATADFALMIVPLLFIGVFVTGIIGGLIPQPVVAGLVGGNSLLSNLVASFTGMIWYFATLTEIPIVEMLMGLGMGPGPALALLLAGPALSLPSILVIYKVIGARKTLVFCLLTVVMSTLVGFVYGMIA